MLRYARCAGYSARTGYSLIREKPFARLRKAQDGPFDRTQDRPFGELRTGLGRRGLTNPAVHPEQAAHSSRAGGPFIPSRRPIRPE